jgi:hypothetical protein
VKLDRVCGGRRCTLHRGAPGKNGTRNSTMVKVSRCASHHLVKWQTLSCIGA